MTNVGLKQHKNIQLYNLSLFSLVDHEPVNSSLSTILTTTTTTIRRTRTRTTTIYTSLLKSKLQHALQGLKHYENDANKIRC